MATYTYALWNNKGGVGKSYLTFQLACEYARLHPGKKTLVVDLCPQANASGMLLGGIVKGEQAIDELCSRLHRRTVAGDVRERIASPYHNPRCGSEYATQVQTINPRIPENLHLVVGDEELEILASRVSRAVAPGPDNASALTHGWIRDLIEDMKTSWNGTTSAAVFIDRNPSFGVYTELALSASDRLVIPFSADGSSKRAVRSVLSLVYGVSRSAGSQKSEYYLRSEEFNTRLPGIDCYVGNRLTQGNYKSANAFRSVVNTIGEEIRAVWEEHPNHFCIAGGPSPRTTGEFKSMFQCEIRDANTASVVSSSLSIPPSGLSEGLYDLPGKKGVKVNQSQLDRLQPNIEKLARQIE